MVSVKLSDINHAATLLKQVVKKADTNEDGAIRAGDINKIRDLYGMQPSTSGNWNDGGTGAQIVSGINSAVGRAKSRGGPTLERISTAIDDLKKLTRAGDKDGDGKLDTNEQKSLKTAGEKNFMQFVVWAKSKSISDIDMPAHKAFERPKFKWSGTPAQVCDSLLLSTGNPKNDNYWPSWGSGNAGASRYVVTASEARDMVTALKNLYVGRQKSVLTELASRTHQSAFGCVSPNTAAQKVFQDYADELGITIELGHPAAPSMPI